MTSTLLPAALLLIATLATGTVCWLWAGKA